MIRRPVGVRKSSSFSGSPEKFVVSLDTGHNDDGKKPNSVHVGSKNHLLRLACFLVESLLVPVDRREILVHWCVSPVAVAVVLRLN